MIRGTTPDYLLTVTGKDLTSDKVFVTIKQNTGALITKTNDDLDIEYSNSNTTIGLTLTQEDTLGLKEGTADIQIRFIDSDGKAEATGIMPILVSRVLLERVISYAADDSV